MGKMIALAAAGSAGHVEPALAVAKALRSIEPSWTCVVVGSDSGIEQKLVPQAGLALRTIPKVTLPRKFTPRALLFPIRLLQTITKTFTALRGVDLVVGFGGYVAAPCYIVARLKRVPIVIHEANAKPGWANRLGVYLTKEVTVAFASARQTGDHWLEAEVVGMPIRSSIQELIGLSPEAMRERRSRVTASLGLDADRPVLLVFGGSLGAQRINAAIEAALPNLLASGVQVIHGVGGTNQLPPARSGYSPHLYLQEMADYYAAADLVISRCGAVTCAELMAVGKYALLIPLPIGNGEQRANAAQLVSDGMAEIIENGAFTGEWLSEHVHRLLNQARLAHPKPSPWQGDREPAHLLAKKIKELA